MKIKIKRKARYESAVTAKQKEKPLARFAKT